MHPRRHAVQHLIDELTELLTHDANELVARRVRYSLALLHAAAESLDELDATYAHHQRRSARSAASVTP